MQQVWNKSKVGNHSGSSISQSIVFFCNLILGYCWLLFSTPLHSEKVSFLQRFAIYILLSSIPNSLFHFSRPTPESPYTWFFGFRNLVSILLDGEFLFSLMTLFFWVLAVYIFLGLLWGPLRDHHMLDFDWCSNTWNNIHDCQKQNTLDLRVSNSMCIQHRPHVWCCIAIVFTMDKDVYSINLAQFMTLKFRMFPKLTHSCT